MLTSNPVDVENDLARFRQESEKSIQLSTEAGLAIDLSEWLTVKRYAERHNLTTQVVTNWIARGVIPTDCTMVLPELNDIRLLKNQVYK